MTKKSENKRSEIIDVIKDLLDTSDVRFDFKVVKRPRGIHIIYECTEEELYNAMIKAVLK